MRQTRKIPHFPVNFCPFPGYFRLFLVIFDQFFIILGRSQAERLFLGLSGSLQLEGFIFGSIVAGEKNRLGGAMRMLLQWIGFGGLLACAAVSLWPFRFRRRWRSWHLYVPAVALVAYGVFELALPNPVNLNWQWRAVVALLFFIWLNGMAKLGVLAALMKRAGGSRRRLRRLPHRRWQMALAIPLALGCALVFWWG